MMDRLPNLGGPGDVLRHIIDAESDAHRLAGQGANFLAEIRKKDADSLRAIARGMVRPGETL